MKNIKLSVLLFSAMLFMNVAGFAATPLVPGWYFEGNLGRSASSNQNFPGTVKNTGFGWNLTGGYQFTQYIAMDVGYTNYAETRIATPIGTTVATETHFSYDLAAKVMLPIANSGFAIFGKGGIGRINSYTSLKNQPAANAYGYGFNTGVHTQTVPYYGAGAAYAILPNLLVNGQWMRAQGSNNIGNLDLYSLGLTYIF